MSQLRLHKNQRFEDKDPMLSFWRRYSPYVHLAGWGIAFIFLTGMYWQQNKDIPARVVALEAKDAQKDIDFASMRQEVHDLHEFLIPKGNK